MFMYLKWELNITENTLGLKPRQKDLVPLQEAFEEIILSIFFFFLHDVDPP